MTQQQEPATPAESRSTRRLRAAGSAVTAVAVCLSVLSWVEGVWWDRGAGLDLFVLQPADEGGALLQQARARDVGSAWLEPLQPAHAGRLTLRWSGVWYLERSGNVRLRARADGDLRVSLDGRVVLEARASQQRKRHQVALELEQGFHALEADWTGRPGEERFRLLWSPGDGRYRGFASDTLLPAEPAAARWLPHRLVRLLAGLVWPAWALAGLLIGSLLVVARRQPCWGLLPPGHRLAPRADARARRLLRFDNLVRVLAVLVVLYGATLRLDALINSFWEVDEWGWTEDVRPWLAEVKPDTLLWPRSVPYVHGDPDAYRDYARSMRHFYEARVRGPVFVFATKLGLWVANDNDIGVGIASAVLSALCIGAVYLLGAYGFGRWVGLLAALAFAIERQVIALSIEGWRDDAFTLGLTLFAYGVLRFYDRGSFGNALLLAFSGAFCWLTRISSLSFLAPVFLALAIFPRGRSARARLGHVGLSVLLCVVLMAPFIVNCAIVFGDPFYAINDYVVFFRIRAGHSYDEPMNVLQYLGSFRFFELADKLFIGYTYHPFASKWNFADWWRPLGPILAGSSILGLFLFLTFPRGRWLLLTHLAALFPFVFSWDVPGGSPWRHSLQAYPFYLVAAAFVLVGAVRLAVSPEARVTLRAWLTPRRGLALAAGAAAIAVSAWGLSLGLHYLRMREALKTGSKSQLVLAGPRDALFFQDGWHPPVFVWKWHARFMRDRIAEVRLPLARGPAYRLTLRMDPFVHDPERPQVVAVSLNGSPLRSFALTWDPGRTGTYQLSVPADLVQDGADRLALRASSKAPASRLPDRPEAVPEAWEAALELRYIRVEPESADP